MMAYHLLLSHWFLDQRQMEGIELELRSLSWLHTNFDRIISAVASS